MSLGLRPINSQPYPQVNGFLDIRDYLVNGWRSAGTQTFCVSARGNEMTLIMRVFGDQATSNYIAENVPIIPPYLLQFQGYYGNLPARLSMNGNGGIVISGQGSAPYPDGEVSAVVTMPRRGTSR